MEQAVTPAELAHEARCHERTIIRMCDRGELPSFRVGNKRRIPRAAAEKFLAGEPIKTPKAAKR